MKDIYKDYKNNSWIIWLLWLIGILLFIGGIVLFIYNILTYFLPYKRRARITLKNEKKIAYLASKKEVEHAKQ